jgi:nucleotide-binding universal stress UspA family protein
MDTLKARRILCPIDFSDGSRRALEEAVRQARRHDADLTVLYVYQMLFAGPEVAIWPTVLPLDEGTRAMLLEHVAQDLRSVDTKDVRLQTMILDGDPFTAIVEQARSLPADLVVMGTHGRRGFSRFVLGSVTERVLHTAPCPVLTVPAVPGPSVAPGHAPALLCAVDLLGSEDTLAAAVALAESQHARLVVAHVVEGLPEDAPAVPFDVPEYRRYREADARQRLHQMIQSKPGRVSIRTIVVTGSPHREILRLAHEEQAEAIVIGSHGPKFVDRMFFGSTAARVVREAPCPVLTVRPGSAAAAKAA